MKRFSSIRVSIVAAVALSTLATPLTGCAGSTEAGRGDGGNDSKEGGAGGTSDGMAGGASGGSVSPANGGSAGKAGSAGGTNRGGDAGRTQAPGDSGSDTGTGNESGAVSRDAGSDTGTGDADSGLTRGLVAYYPFDGDMRDHSGNGNDCIGVGPNPTEDRNGKANSAYLFEFASYMDCGSGSSVHITGDLTLSAWANADSGSLTGSNTHLVSRWSFSTNESFALGIHATDQTQYSAACTTTPGPFFAVKDTGSNSDFGSTLCGTGSITTGAWHHFVGVFRAGEKVSVYLDGQLAGTSTQSVVHSVYDGISHLTIGEDDANPTNYFQGSLDEIRVYDRALGDAEVAALP